MAKAPTKTGKKKVFKKKEKKTVLNGIVYVQATFNNTIVSITDTQGNLVCWSSAGSLGFKGSRKGTPFAAQQASSTVASKAREHGMKSWRFWFVDRAPAGNRPSARCRQLVWK
jgi:small subunit ribosomal protein S11